MVVSSVIRRRKEGVVRRGGEEDQSVEKLDEIRNEGQRDKVPFVSLDYDYLLVGR